jgi:hypothetical protein
VDRRDASVFRRVEKVARRGICVGSSRADDSAPGAHLQPGNFPTSASCVAKGISRTKVFTDGLLGQMTRTKLPMGFLMTRCAECDQIFASVIALPAARLNVMDLKSFRSPTPLATPPISLQNFPTELAISFLIKLQAGSSGTDPSQIVLRTFSRSWSL